MYNSGEWSRFRPQWNITVVVLSGVDLTVRPKQWWSPHSHTRLLSARSIDTIEQINIYLVYSSLSYRELRNLPFYRKKSVSSDFFL